MQGNHGSWDYWVARLKICKDDLQITENLQLGEKFEANSMIESNSKILPVGNIIFDAGKKIILNPGFEAQTGGIFQAYIDGCGKK